jgi:hypothetical protein
MSLGETRNGRHKSTRPHRPVDAIDAIADFLRGDFDSILAPDLNAFRVSRVRFIEVALVDELLGRRAFPWIVRQVQHCGGPGR